MIVGYARVSTADQTLALQLDALKKAGCEKVFQDVAGGARCDRKGLEQALEFVRAGDTLVIWRLDRLGRSLKHLIQVMTDLNTRDVELLSLQEKIDTSTSGGKLIFHVFCALAEFERDLIRERTTAGLMAARVRGRRGGRPKKLTEKALAIAHALRDTPDISVADICKQLHISRATYYRGVSSGAVRSLKSVREGAAETEASVQTG